MKRPSTSTFLILLLITLFYAYYHAWNSITKAKRHVTSTLRRNFHNKVTTSIEETNEIRKQRVKEYCRKTRPNPSILAQNELELLEETPILQRPRFYFTDTVNLLYCATAKCGTTQWRMLMLALDGHLNASQIQVPQDTFQMSLKHNLLWNKFNLLDPRDAAGITERMHSHYKFFTTREPLERLVSAYRNKLERTDNTIYGKLSRQIHQLANKMGYYVVASQGEGKRGAGGSALDFVAYNIALASRHSTDTAVASAAQQKPTLDQAATFEEFIDHILATKDRKLLDVHWRPYSELCHPCTVEYDYIAKMETIYDDVKYITDKLGIPRKKLGLFSETGKENLQENRTALYHEYFSKIPASKRDAIFLHYKDQFDMFGYDYPKFINVTKVMGT